ncbi:MAG: hypothetical protein CW338_01390 [Clostridiales bacterium]|nr:hypothetical protein [Clostridiales bacterium]
MFSTGIFYTIAGFQGVLPLFLWITLWIVWKYTIFTACIKNDPKGVKRRQKPLKKGIFALFRKTRLCINIILYSPFQVLPVDKKKSEAPRTFKKFVT